MYKAEELCGLLIKPKINDIDLDVLQDYYRKFLNPFIYQYDITENENQPGKNTLAKYGFDDPLAVLLCSRRAASSIS